MQLFAIFNELWRRRIVVGIALIVSVFLGLMVAFKVTPGLPPKLTPRAHEIGLASTRVLINTPNSIVADLNPAGGDSLATHAQLLGNLLSSDRVHDAIAKSAGLAPTELTISPLAVGGVIQTPLAVTAPAPVGASSVSVNADPLLPLINIKATAPTPTQAAALANGSVRVLQSYIQTVAADRGHPDLARPGDHVARLRGGPALDQWTVQEVQRARDHPVVRPLVLRDPRGHRRQGAHPRAQRVAGHGV